MGTRGETTVEIGAALLHHHSHLPRNHIYHVIGSCVVSPLSFANHNLDTAFHSMHSMSKKSRGVCSRSASAALNASREIIFLSVSTFHVKNS